MRDIYKELKTLRKQNRKLAKANKQLKKKIHKVEHPTENVNRYTVKENIRKRILAELISINVIVHRHVENDSLEDMLAVLKRLSETKVPLFVRILSPSTKKMYDNLANIHSKYSFIYEQCKMYLNLEV